MYRFHNSLNSQRIQTWNISYIEKQYHCKLEEEIIHLQQIIAQSNEETRQYIEKDIDEIRFKLTNPSILSEPKR